jgi:hypothetical protein
MKIFTPVASRRRAFGKYFMICQLGAAVGIRHFFGFGPNRENLQVQRPIETLYKGAFVEKCKIVDFALWAENAKFSPNWFQLTSGGLFESENFGNAFVPSLHTR